MGFQLAKSVLGLQAHHQTWLIWREGGLRDVRHRGYICCSHAGQFQVPQQAKPNRAWGFLPPFQLWIDMTLFSQQSVKAEADQCILALVKSFKRHWALRRYIEANKCHSQMWLKYLLTWVWNMCNTMGYVTTCWGTIFWYITWQTRHTFCIHMNIHPSTSGFLKRKNKTLQGGYCQVGMYNLSLEKWVGCFVGRNN